MLSLVRGSSPFSRITWTCGQGLLANFSKSLKTQFQRKECSVKFIIGGIWRAFLTLSVRNWSSRLSRPLCKSWPARSKTKRFRQILKDFILRRSEWAEATKKLNGITSTWKSLSHPCPPSSEQKTWKLFKWTLESSWRPCKTFLILAASTKKLAWCPSSIACSNWWL